MSGMTRLNVYLPTYLVERVDRVIGAGRQRSAFVAAAIREKLGRDGELADLPPVPAAPSEGATVDLGDGIIAEAVSGSVDVYALTERRGDCSNCVRFRGWSPGSVASAKRMLHRWWIDRGRIERARDRLARLTA